MELLSKPGAAGIIEKIIDGELHILIQERVKKNAPQEAGLFEIPAGKVREYENIYDCLRREVNEETGLTVTEIENENESVIYENNGYKVLSYVPFASAQNICGNYPIMVQTFICRANGDMLNYSSEARNFKWISLKDLNDLIHNQTGKFYPMHVTTLRHYLRNRHSNV